MYVLLEFPNLRCESVITLYTYSYSKLIIHMTDLVSSIKKEKIALVCNYLGPVGPSSALFYGAIEREIPGIP